MLNIEDIRKMHQSNPEPPEVAAIRSRITEEFKDLVFDPVPHKYFVNGQEYQSVSAASSEFEEKKNWDMIAETYAVKNSRTVESVKREWKEKNIISTNNGTSVHLFLESYMWFFLGHPEKIDPVILPQYEDGFLIPFGQKQWAGANYFKSIYDSMMDPNVKRKVYPVMPEIRMYFKENNPLGINARIAGTSDILLAFRDETDGLWKLKIEDWKTNQSLISPYNRTYNIMMLPPFDSMIEESMSHYSLQLSYYSLMLKQLGFEVVERNVIWLKNEDSAFEKISMEDNTERLHKYLKMRNV